jgi:hypothetical protein
MERLMYEAKNEIQEAETVSKEQETGLSWGNNE